MSGKPDSSTITGVLASVVFREASSSHIRNYARGPGRRRIGLVLSPEKANALLYEEEVHRTIYPPRSAIGKILFFSKLQLVYHSHISQPLTRRCSSVMTSHGVIDELCSDTSAVFFLENVLTKRSIQRYIRPQLELRQCKHWSTCPTESSFFRHIF